MEALNDYKKQKDRSQLVVDMEVEGTNSVKLKMYDRNLVRLTKGRHAQEIKKNLVSIGQLEVMDCNFSIGVELQGYEKQIGRFYA